MYFTNEFGKIYYEYFSEINAPTLIFSSGVSIDHQTFSKQVEALKDKYRVIVWDYPFHGKSDTISKKISFTKIAATFIIGIMDELKIDKAILVGQSFGSFVSQVLASSHPNRVSALVHIGGMSLYPKYGSFVKLLKPITSLLMFLYPSKMVYKSFAKHKALKDDTRKYLQESATKTGKKTITHVTKAMVDDMARGIDKPLEFPTLMVYGDHDIKFIKKGNLKSHKNHSNSDLVEIKNAHHIANQDNSKDFNKALIEFLEKIKQII